MLLNKIKIINFIFYKFEIGLAGSFLVCIVNFLGSWSSVQIC